MVHFLLACTLDEPVPTDEIVGGRLAAAGTSIVDAGGNPVLLRGVNLGGWLFHETWITNVDYSTYGRFWEVAVRAGFQDEAEAAIRGAANPGDLSELESALATVIGAEPAEQIRLETETFPSVYDDSDLPLRQLLETRFGTSGRDQLLDAFQQTWVQESDIEWLKNAGFNHVRVPIGYRTLVTNSDLSAPTELLWNEAAFSRIDDLLDWCASHGMYAILDIQEAPGGQNNYSGESTLYSDPTMQDLTVELWGELSRRYADRDEVAAYSLLAEPMSAPDFEASVAMYDRLVDAIRAGGDDHLLVIHDGFFGLDTLPIASEMGWENVVYSTHFFEWGVESSQSYDVVRQLVDAQIGTAQVEQDVPYFIGSFSTMEDEDWAYQSAADYVDWYAEHSWGWALWTYKRMDDPVDTAIWGSATAWGVKREPWAGFERPDAWRDSEAELERKFRAYGGEMAVNADLLAALQGG